MFLSELFLHEESKVKVEGRTHQAKVKKLLTDCECHGQGVITMGHVFDDVKSGCGYFY